MGKDGVGGGGRCCGVSFSRLVQEGRPPMSGGVEVARSNWQGSLRFGHRRSAAARARRPVGGDGVGGWHDLAG